MQGNKSIAKPGKVSKKTIEEHDHNCLEQLKSHGVFASNVPLPFAVSCFCFSSQVPIVPLWEAVRCGHGPVCGLLPDAVSLLRRGEGAPGWRPSIREHTVHVRNKNQASAARPGRLMFSCSLLSGEHRLDAAQSGGLHPSLLRLLAL